MIEAKEPEIYQKAISEDTFKGNWPFTVDSGILVNNLNSIVFITKDYRSYAINGLAQDRFKRFKKVGGKRLFFIWFQKRIHKLDSNGFFVSLSDIIMYGLKMNPKFKV